MSRSFHWVQSSSHRRFRNDPTPDRGSQLPRAAALIISSLGFIHDLRTGILEPDTVRGTPLDMDQYTRLFGTARIPTDVRRLHRPCGEMIADVISPPIFREVVKWKSTQIPNIL